MSAHRYHCHNNNNEVIVEVGVFRMSLPPPPHTDTLPNLDHLNTRPIRAHDSGGTASDSESPDEVDDDEDFMGLTVRPYVKTASRPTVLATPQTAARPAQPPTPPAAPRRSAARLAWENKQRRVWARDEEVRQDAALATKRSFAAVVAAGQAHATPPSSPIMIHNGRPRRSTSAADTL